MKKEKNRSEDFSWMKGRLGSDRAEEGKKGSSPTRKESGTTENKNESTVLECCEEQKQWKIVYVATKLDIYREKTLTHTNAMQQNKTLLVNEVEQDITGVSEKWQKKSLTKTQETIRGR